MTLLTMLFSSKAYAQSAATETWVPQFVLEPSYRPNVTSTWADFHYFGDVDSDSYGDIAVVERLNDWGPKPGYDRWMLRPLPRPWSSRQAFVPSPKENSAWALLLRFPGRIVAGGLQPFGYPRDLELWDVDKHEQVGTVPLPPPPSPGLPPVRNWGNFYNTGDVDLDGWDDFWFLTGVLDTSVQPNIYYDVVGLISGRTLAALWLHYYPNGDGIFSISPQHLDHWGDLNGDGHLDVVAIQYDAATASMDWVAFSGPDGSTIWRYHNPFPIYYPWRPWGQVGDLDGDGARDIAIAEWPVAGQTWTPGRLWVISGRDAHVLWEIPIGKLLPWYGNPRPDKGIDFRSITSLGDWDRDGILDILIPVREQHDMYTWFPWSRYAAWIFSGLDGTPLAYEYLAEDLSPWYPADTLDRPMNGFLSHLGDVDGDGWTELTAIVYSHDLSTSSIYRYRYVFYGRRTLKAPAEVALGQTVSYGLDVPAGAGLPYQVLLSTELAWPGEGMVVGDGWELPIRPSALTRQTQANGHLRGVLDAQGRAQASFPLPRVPALQGRDVYAVAVVENPAHADGIQTITTLAISHVRP